jgi:two-component system phosphate regulon sensor histidine kinase PhoR
MPPLDSWLVITTRVPFWALLLIALFLVGSIVFGIIYYQRRRVRNQSAITELESLRSQIEEIQEKSKQPALAEEAYLQFLYNISHEVSNPLQSIQTNLDNLAQCSPEEVGRWQQYLRIIEAEIIRLADLTENLRLLSHLETPGAPVRREPVNLKAVVEDVIMAQAEFAEARGVRLFYNGPNRPAQVLGNRDHLRQVLTNLVDNGIKYARDGGGEVIIRVQDDPDRLHVRVIDDGIGIPDADLPYIFDTAYRALDSHSLRRTGSGLGLAIVKRIVEQHEGEIQVESQPGRGTIFSFNLPLYHPS